MALCCLQANESAHLSIYLDDLSSIPVPVFVLQLSNSRLSSRRLQRQLNPRHLNQEETGASKAATTKGDGALQYTTGLRQNNGRRSEEGDINTLGASGRA